MDRLLFETINGLSFRNNFLDFLAIFIGEYLGYILLASLLFFLLYKKEVFFQAIISGTISRFIFVFIIRALYYRERPFLQYDITPLIEHAPTASFPSGHASFFFALSTAIFIKNKKIGSLFLILSFLISISRVFSGIHFPSDIIFGAIIGVLTAVFVSKLCRGRDLNPQAHKGNGF